MDGQPCYLSRMYPASGPNDQDWLKHHCKPEMDKQTDGWKDRLMDCKTGGEWMKGRWMDRYLLFISFFAFFGHFPFFPFFLHSCLFSSFSKFHHSSFFISLLLSFLSTSSFHFFSVLLFLSFFICSVIFHYFFPVFFPLVPSFYFNTRVSILFFHFSVFVLQHQLSCCVHISEQHVDSFHHKHESNT